MIPMGRAVLAKQPVHIPDARADPAYIERFLGMVGLVELAGGRTLLQVPMINENDVVGMIAIYRQEVRPFTDKQIELMKNFASQAVIAIENTRLLNELRQRTDELTQRSDDLSEALEQQTATSEVLRVISSSAGELEPVFQAVLENAVRICKAKFGNLYLREGDGFRAAAMYNAPPAYAEQRAGLLHPSPKSTVGKTIQTKQPAQTADITKLPGYLDRDPWLISAVSQGGYRSVLGVPILHDDELIGCIAIFRQEVGAFAD